MVVGMENNECNLLNVCLTDREIKGYNFETRVDNILRQSNIVYNGNPLGNTYEWKRRQGKGSDFKIPYWNWEMEAKSSNGKVFPSWIIRDWIPRFKKNSFKVTIYNETMKLPTKSLELCFNHDIYLVSIDMLGYVLKTEKKRRVGNKLIEANKPIESKLIEANKEVNKPNSNKSIEGNRNSMLEPKIPQKTIVEYLDFDTHHRHIVDKIKIECQSCKYHKLCKHFAKLIIYEDIKSKQDLLISGYYLGYAKSRCLKCLKCLEEKKLIVKSRLSVWQSDEYLDDEGYMEKIEYVRQTYPEYNPQKVVYYASPELSYVFSFSEYNVKCVCSKELEPSNFDWNIKKRHKDKLENNILKRDKWNYQTL
jgi:hypothetical protein